MALKLTQEKKNQIDKIVDKYDVQDGTTLMLLKDVEKLFNSSLPVDVLDYVSQKVGVPLSKLYGVSTFYSLFSSEERGKYIIRICESPPCHLMGSMSVIESLKEELGVNVGETTECGKFTLETTSCLGICAVAPAMMINDEMYGNLTPTKIKEILSNLP